MKYLFVILLCIISNTAYSSIGIITQSEGPSKIHRESGTIVGDTDSDVFSMDRIETFKDNRSV